jgi:hypothetical protein
MPSFRAGASVSIRHSRARTPERARSARALEGAGPFERTAISNGAALAGLGRQKPGTDRCGDGWRGPGRERRCSNRRSNMSGSGQIQAR